MPTSVGTSVLVLAAILTTCFIPGAVFLAVAATIWEGFIFYQAGTDL